MWHMAPPHCGQLWLTISARSLFPLPGEGVVNVIRSPACVQFGEGFRHWSQQGLCLLRVCWCGDDGSGNRDFHFREPTIIVEWVNSNVIWMYIHFYILPFHTFYRLVLDTPIIPTGFLFSSQCQQFQRFSFIWKHA